MLNNVNRQDSGGLANTNEVASPIGVPGKRELDAWESFAAQQAASSDIGFARINLALLVLSMSPSKSDAAIGHLSDDGCLQKRTRFQRGATFAENALRNTRLLGKGLTRPVQRI